MTTTAHHRPAGTAAHLPRRRDDGSLMLAMLFTLMLTALLLVVAAAMVSGLNKSRASREYAVAFQAADSAFADVLMTANLDPTRFTPTSPTPLTRPDGPVTVPDSQVTWTWTATRTSTRTWSLDVSAEGPGMDRHFTATLKSSRVSTAVRSLSDGTFRYRVNSTQQFERGFFGADRFTVVSGTPDIDGYNGAIGTVGSGGPLALTNARVDEIDLWNWTTDTGRCTGTPCTEVPVNRLKEPVIISGSGITTACANPANQKGAWASSSGTALIAGACYSNLMFDQSRLTFNLTGPVYVTGNVTVTNNVNINTTPGDANADSSTLRIALRGDLLVRSGADVAMAVYAPAGTCRINGDLDTLYATRWSGAATCKAFETANNPRLRYDGGLGLINDGAVQATDKTIFAIYDYHAID